MIVPLLSTDAEVTAPNPIKVPTLVSAPPAPVPLLPVPFASPQLFARLNGDVR